MSVELISVLIAMLAVGSGLGWVDPDQQSRVAAGGAGKREDGSEIDRWGGLQGAPRTELGGNNEKSNQLIGYGE